MCSVGPFNCLLQGKIRMLVWCIDYKSVQLGDLALNLYSAVKFTE